MLLWCLSSCCSSRSGWTESMESFEASLTSSQWDHFWHLIQMHLVSALTFSHKAFLNLKQHFGKIQPEKPCGWVSKRIIWFLTELKFGACGWRLYVPLLSPDRHSSRAFFKKSTLHLLWSCHIWRRHVCTDVQKSLESFIPTLKATRMCQTVFDALGMKLGFLLLRNDNLVLMIQRCSHRCWLGETYVNLLWSVLLTDMRKIPRHTVLLEPLQIFLSGCPNSVAGLRLNAEWISISLSEKGQRRGTLYIRTLKGRRVTIWLWCLLFTL